ncbi:MAG TPA: hypothetical protein VGP72_31315 [Planctomycetota bacterium]|jgi:hypothetical protein
METDELALLYALLRQVVQQMAEVLFAKLTAASRDVYLAIIERGSSIVAQLWAFITRTIGRISTATMNTIRAAIDVFVGVSAKLGSLMAPAA